MQFILAVRDVRYSDVSGAVGHPVVGGIDRNYDRTHFRMNVTEQKADPETIESNRIGCSRFIEPEIKSFAIKQRENIMKEWIAIGKIHR